LAQTTAHTGKISEKGSKEGRNKKSLRAKECKEGSQNALGNSTCSLAVFYVEQVALNRHVRRNRGCSNVVTNAGQCQEPLHRTKRQSANTLGRPTVRSTPQRDLPRHWNFKLCPGRGPSHLCREDMSFETDFIFVLRRFELISRSFFYGSQSILSLSFISSFLLRCYTA